MNQEEIRGTVNRLLFQSADTGYTVLVLDMSQNHSTVVTGHLPNISPGQQVTLKGAWTMHSKFGKQFQANECTAFVPTTVLGLEKYLGSGLIKGIGKVYAKKLVQQFGTEVLEIIDKTPERLNEVEGIGPKRAECIATAWQDQKEISSIMIFLQEKGISPVFAAKIYKKYGKESVAVLTENPYRLAEDIWGVGFKSADTIAQNLGFEKHSIARAKAGILHTISTATSQGHLYLKVGELKKQATKLLELDIDKAEATLKNALHELYNSDKIKLISQSDEHFITLTQFYFSERGVAQKIRTLLDHKSNHEFDLDAIYQTLRTPQPNTIALNEDQQRAILSCLQHKVSVITGGPGTGKTTLIRQLLQVLDTHNIIYKLAAPTGRAAKRIIQGTGRNAATLHRLLQFDPNTMGFVHNEQNALKLDFLIIDEASMIDTFLAHAVLKAVPLSAHLIFIGDVDQLPSVGAGNILHDLIASGPIASTRLTHIFRQAQDSLITLNAHRINKGEFPSWSLPDAKKDFLFIKEEEPEQVFNHLKRLYQAPTGRISIKDHESIVLVPMNRGVVGTVKLNHDLQQILNAPQTEHSVQYMGTTFKPGDKVMQARNNYDKLVFNGDIGEIKTIDTQEKQLIIAFDNRLVEYDFDELSELMLAYAISIHKSQGSEYEVAIIPIFMQHFMLLQRNLIYTAITRAKKLCIFIGQPKALAIAIKNNKTTVRKTFLQEFLTTDLMCR